jgi:hypothetical protein
MVDGCEFVECGNEAAPAVDPGHGELMSFTRCTVRTRGKTVAAEGILDMTNMPASVDFWVRFRSYPEAGRDGLAVLVDAGSEEKRNRLCLLYDRTGGEFIARLQDGTLRDPTIEAGRQILEVRAKRPIDLETWYHLRLAWDGARAGASSSSSTAAGRTTTAATCASAPGRRTSAIGPDTSMRPPGSKGSTTANAAASGMRESFARASISGALYSPTRPRPI